MLSIACALLSCASIPAFPASAPVQAEEAPLPGLEQALALEELFTALRERVARSVVTVSAYERDPEQQVDQDPAERAAWMRQLDREYPGFRLIGSGSGVILDAEGDVLSNRHILLKADGTPADLVDVETVDGRHTISKIVGLEPTLNMAVLQLEVFSAGNPPDFSPIALGNSSTVRPGQMAVAVGDPFGPEKFFATGHFTGTPDRECYQEQLTAAYLQVGLQLPPGAFGGALVNLRGELVGMLTPRDPAALMTPIGERPPAQQEGIEFALPSNIVQALFSTIKKNESLRSPWLGFAVMSLGELRQEIGGEALGELSRPRSGIYIENVFDPGPAQAAGVQPGDFLTSFGGVLIGSPLDFQRQLYMAGIGNSATLEFFRDGETFARELVIEPRPAQATTR